MTPYQAFVTLAILGRMREADGLMHAYHREILDEAVELRVKYGVPESSIYRGLLLEDRPWESMILLPRYSDTFSSWSENLDLACWFADPNGEMSTCVTELHPEFVGWLAQSESHSNVEQVLYHYTWPVSLAQDPSGQVAWNQQTQQEVICVPRAMRIVRHDEKRTAKLDAQFCLPEFLAEKEKL